MGRSAPGTERTIAVLDFLAAHPGEGFTVSELSRRLGQSKATCHAVVTTLAMAGYLLRHPTSMSYRLGPALIVLGSAAEGELQAVEYARDEMRALSDRLDLECLATAVIGDEMVVLARAGRPRGLAGTVPVGQRLPLTPPLGSVFMAWAEDEEVERWLARAPDGETERHRLALHHVRERGYAVGLEPDPTATLGQALAHLSGEARPTRVRSVVAQLLEELGQDEYMLTTVEPAHSYRVNHVVAPVFGPEGRVELALSLFGFPGRITGDELADLADQLRAATRTVTKSIHGSEP